MLTGEFGIADVYLSLPCILGAGGVRRVLQPELDAVEVEAMRASAATLRNARSRLG